MIESQKVLLLQRFGFGATLELYGNSGSGRRVAELMEWQARYMTLTHPQGVLRKYTSVAVLCETCNVIVR